MADVNWNLALYDPIAKQKQGFDYATQVAGQAALLRAGSQYAGGDISGAANTVARSGDFKTAGDILDAPQKRATAAADLQAKQIKAQQDYMGQAVKVLGAIHQQKGPQALQDAFQQILPDLKGLGTSDAALQQLMTAVRLNPEGTLRALAEKVNGVQVKSGDNTLLVRPDTGEKIAEYTGPATPPDVKTIISGNQEYTGQWNPQTKQWDTLGSPGPRYRPVTVGEPGSGVGKSIEERDDDILINGDPSTPEYAASFARRSRPIVSFDPQTGQPRTVTPDVSWARQPTYRGVAGGQPQAGGPPPPSTGGGQPSPKAPGQPTITGGGASPARATFEANASLAQKDIAVAQSVFFPHGIDKELNRSELVRSNLPQTPGRAAMQALERAIETILRIRSGAAIGAAEVAKYMNLYGPSVFDSDAGAATKLKRLNEFFEESKQIAAGREGTSNTPPPPAETPPQAQPQPQAVPRVPYAPGRGPTGAAQPNKTLRFQDLP